MIAVQHNTGFSGSQGSAAQGRAGGSKRRSIFGVLRFKGRKSKEVPERALPPVPARVGTFNGTEARPTMTASHTMAALPPINVPSSSSVTASSSAPARPTVRRPGTAPDASYAPLAPLRSAMKATTPSYRTSPPLTAVERLTQSSIGEGKEAADSNASAVAAAPASSAQVVVPPRFEKPPGGTLNSSEKVAYLDWRLACTLVERLEIEELEEADRQALDPQADDGGARMQAIMSAKQAAISKRRECALRGASPLPPMKDVLTSVAMVPSVTKRRSVLYDAGEPLVKSPSADALALAPVLERNDSGFQALSASSSSAAGSNRDCGLASKPTSKFLSVIGGAAAPLTRSRSTTLGHQGGLLAPSPNPMDDVEEIMAVDRPRSRLGGERTPGSRRDGGTVARPSTAGQQSDSRPGTSDSTSNTGRLSVSGGGKPLGRLVSLSRKKVPSAANASESAAGDANLPTSPPLPSSKGLLSPPRIGRTKSMTRPKPSPTPGSGPIYERTTFEASAKAAAAQVGYELSQDELEEQYQRYLKAVHLRRRAAEAQAALGEDEEDDEDEDGYGGVEDGRATRMDKVRGFGLIALSAMGGFAPPVRRQYADEDDDDDGEYVDDGYGRY